MPKKFGAHYQATFGVFWRIKEHILNSLYQSTQNGIDCIEIQSKFTIETTYKNRNVSYKMKYHYG